MTVTPGLMYEHQMPGTSGAIRECESIGYEHSAAGVVNLMTPEQQLEFLRQRRFGQMDGADGYITARQPTNAYMTMTTPPLVVGRRPPPSAYNPARVRRVLCLSIRERRALQLVRPSTSADDIKEEPRSQVGGGGPYARMRRAQTSELSANGGQGFNQLDGAHGDSGALWLEEFT